MSSLNNVNMCCCFIRKAVLAKDNSRDRSMCQIRYYRYFLQQKSRGTPKHTKGYARRRNAQAIRLTRTAAATSPPDEARRQLQHQASRNHRLSNECCPTTNLCRGACMVHTCAPPAHRTWCRTREHDTQSSRLCPTESDTDSEPEPRYRPH